MNQNGKREHLQAAIEKAALILEGQRA